ncbi:hypothetical protein DFH28DRAFT_883375, partial [Melampsora americana]
WTQCPNTSCQFDAEKATGQGLLWHSNYHNNIWPDRKEANPLVMRTFTNVVVADPKAGPLVLIVSFSIDFNSPIKNPNIGNFGNGGCLASLRQKVLVSKGLMPEKESLGGGDWLIMDLMHWGQ